MHRRSHFCRERPSAEGPGLGSPPPTSAPGLGPPLPHLPRDWANPARSAPGLDSTARKQVPLLLPLLKLHATLHVACCMACTPLASRAGASSPACCGQTRTPSVQCSLRATSNVQHEITCNARRASCCGRAGAPSMQSASTVHQHISECVRS